MNRAIRGLSIAVIAVAFLAACANEQEVRRERETAVSRGYAYADAACASCHALLPGKILSPHPAAPSFQDVADTPGMTRTAFNVWLHSPHPSMPNYIVEPDRVDDLWAYVASLKEPRR